MTPEQEQRLTSGGDCPDHFHSTDRLKTHNDVVDLVVLEDFIRIYSNYSFERDAFEYILADSTLGNVDITLPAAKKKMKTTVVKTVAANTVTIYPPSGSLINGGASYALTAAYAKATVKAIDGDYYVVA